MAESGASEAHGAEETIAAPLRRTAQREATLAALGGFRSFVSAQTLFDHLRSERAAVSLATVYRHLNAFVDSGVADTISQGGHQLFRACGRASRHHHVVCSSCGREADIDPPLDWIDGAVASAGYEVEHLVLEISGRCTDCRA